MAGRRVRCRNCGTVFPLVPHEGAQPSTAGDSHTGAHATARMDTDDLARETGLIDTAPEPTPPAYEGLLASTPVAPPSLPETPDAVFQDAFQDYKPKTRPNDAYKFPTATELDRWLPIVLPVVGLVWLTLETLGTGAATPGWVGPLRLVLFLGLFAGLVWPATLWAVRLASQQLKFDLPPLPKYRVLAAFAVPFALAFILWQSTENLNGLITGSVVGLALGLATVWLLLRITPDEAPKTLGFSGAAFAATVAISAGVLAGLNAIALAAAKDSKSPTTLAASPIVPGLPWVQPAPPDARPRPKERVTPPEGPPENVAGSDNTVAKPVDPSAPPAPAAPTTTEPAVVVGPDPVVPNQPPVRPDAVAPATTDPGSNPAAVAVKPASPTTRNGSVLFNEDPRSPRRTAVAAGNPTPGAPGPTVTAPPPVGANGLPRPGGDVPPPAAPTNPDVANGGTPAAPGTAAGQPDAFITAISEAHSPLVAEVAPVTTSAKLVGMAPPLTSSSNSVLLLESSPVEKQEQLEVWSLSPTPKLRFQRPPFPQTQDRAYVVSPDGTQSARIVQFPNLSIEVWSNDKGVSSKLVPMQQQGGKPVLLGFLAEDKVLVWWESGMEAGLEPYDIRAGQHLRPILLPVHGRTSGNGAVSPDGKAFAIVLKDKEKPRVALYTLVGNAGVRSFVLPQMDLQMADPVAMSFSADGKKLAILFEHNGDAVLYDLHLAESKPPIGPILLPAGTLPMASSAQPARGRQPSVLPSDANILPGCPHPAAGREMSWLADGASLLVRGDTVIDGDTGQVKGRLGAKDVLSQVVSGNTCLLAYRDSAADLRLACVTLKVSGAAAAPQPAHSAPAPAAAPGRSAATRPAGPSGAIPGAVPTAVPAGVRAIPAAGPAPRSR